MKRILGYFLQGMLYLAPIGITIYIIAEVFIFSDNLLQDFLEMIYGKRIPGIGLLIMVLFVTALGYAGQTIIARPIKRLFNTIITRIPIIELIYRALNDLFSAVVGKERKFNKPVLVRINEVSNLERLGFITADDLSAFGLQDKVVVYFPYCYTFTGEMFIAPVKDVKVLDLPAKEVMKFIVSGGVAEVNRDSGKHTH